MGDIIREDRIGEDRIGDLGMVRLGGGRRKLGLKYKEKNGDRVFDIEIGKMSKSDMIKYCRDEWIVIPTDVMRRLRGKEKKE